MRGIDQHITRRLRRCAREEGITHGIEKRPALKLETIQPSACAGAGQADFHRQIEDQRQVGAQITLDEGFQRRDPLQRQDRADADLAAFLEACVQASLAVPRPDPASILTGVFAPEVPALPWTPTTPAPKPEPVTMAQALNLALRKIEFLDGVFDGRDANAADGFDADVALATGELKVLIPALVEALGGEVALEGGAA